MEVTASQPIKLCKIMKKISMLLFVCFLVLTVSVFAQIKVITTGKVGIACEPDATYPLSVGTMIFKTGGGYPDLIVGYNAPGSPVKSIFPSISGNCEIGTSQYQFFSMRARYFYANGVLVTSDERLKENFRSIDKPLDKILQISGAKYDFKVDGTDTIKDAKQKQIDIKLKKDRLGFIAQDLQKIVPEAVIYNEEEDRYFIDYNAVIPILVEAIKEQQSQIEQLKNNIEGCCKSNLKNATISTESNDMLAENIAQLDQNIPNPFSQETKIGCTIPESSTSAVLYIYNMNGTQLQQHNVNGKGKQTITISGNSLDPGMYLYALVIDSKEVDTKRMILTK
jgi:hypothetical protein